MKLKSKFHAVIPASGIGSRFGGRIPKQYSVMANGNTILDNVLQIFIENGNFDRIVVVINENDTWFKDSLFTHHPQVCTVTGGADRFVSVNNAIEFISQSIDSNDFICIHDSVRPCVTHIDINNLLQQVDADDVGGLLVSPVVDTLKLSKANSIVSTIDRTNVYHALTPQVYRLKILQSALQHVIKNNIAITDDASSIEALGKESLAVVGDKNNIKITTKQDLALANLIQ